MEHLDQIQEIGECDKFVNNVETALTKMAHQLYPNPKSKVHLSADGQRYHNDNMRGLYNSQLYPNQIKTIIQKWSEKMFQP